MSEEVQEEVAVEAPAVERPEWLPEKFKTPEACAEGYSNLEKKFDSNKYISCKEYSLFMFIKNKENKVEKSTFSR